MQSADYATDIIIYYYVVLYIIYIIIYYYILYYATDSCAVTDGAHDIAEDGVSATDGRLNEDGHSVTARARSGC